jgi:hypothetical protein
LWSPVVPPETSAREQDRGDPGAAPQRAVWSDQPRWAGSGATRLVIELADLAGHPARVIARRHKALLEAYLAELLARTGIGQPRDVAREIWLLSEGAISSILVRGDHSYVEAAARAAKRLVQSNTPNTRLACRARVDH